MRLANGCTSRVFHYMFNKKRIRRIRYGLSLKVGDEFTGCGSNGKTVVLIRKEIKRSYIGFGSNGWMIREVELHDNHGGIHWIGFADGGCVDVPEGFKG